MKQINLSDYIRNAESKFSGFNGLNGYESQYASMPEFNPNVYGFDGRTMPVALDSTPSLVANNTVAVNTPRVVPIVAAPKSQPYQVIVTNRSGGTLPVVLFGAYRNEDLPNFGNSAEIQLVGGSPNVTYAQILKELSNQPVTISSTKIVSSNIAQVTAPLSVATYKANGDFCGTDVIVDNYFSANQFQDNRVVVDSPMTIDGNTQITFNILPNTTVSFSFFPSAQVNLARNLGGLNDLQVFSQANIGTAVPVFAAPLPAAQTVTAVPATVA